MYTRLITLVLVSLALAMGVAVVVIENIGTVAPVDTATLLGLGLAALGLANLRDRSQP
jgi:hypothetical protein